VGRSSGDVPLVAAVQVRRRAEDADTEADVVRLQEGAVQGIDFMKIHFGQKKLGQKIRTKKFGQKNFGQKILDKKFRTNFFPANF
jgi:thiamine biosynthesis protein ThiC